MLCRTLLFACLCFGVFAVGCSPSDGPRPVTGTVKFSDGSVPQGEVAVIRFDPGSSTAKGSPQRPASGAIRADGSFALTTFEEEDGAIPGKYKVVLAVFTKHDKPESPVPAAYLRAETTPLEATVVATSNQFDFIVNRP